jgi:hypothetical protein
MYAYVMQLLIKKELRGLSPQANYTDQRPPLVSEVQLLIRAGKYWPMHSLTFLMELSLLFHYYEIHKMNMSEIYIYT